MLDSHGDIDSKTDLEDAFLRIREDVDAAESRSRLDETYRRAGYLITLSHAPAWSTRFGPEAATLREIGRQQFAITVRKINRKAVELGDEGDYSERWGRSVSPSPQRAAGPRQTLG